MKGTNLLSDRTAMCKGVKGEKRQGCSQCVIGGELGDLSIEKASKAKGLKAFNHWACCDVGEVLG